jgi:hypothetical protein
MGNELESLKGIRETLLKKGPSRSLPKLSPLESPRSGLHSRPLRGLYCFAIFGHTPSLPRPRTERFGSHPPPQGSANSAAQRGVCGMGSRKETKRTEPPSAREVSSACRMTEGVQRAEANKVPWSATQKTIDSKYIRNIAHLSKPLGTCTPSVGFADSSRPQGPSNTVAKQGVCGMGSRKELFSFSG